MTTTVDTILVQGMRAAKAGRRDQARELLLKVLEVDDRNERAWLWLGGVVDDPAQTRTCLENVLAINPSNPHARQGLAWLESRAARPAPPPQPAHAQAAAAVAAAPQPGPAAPAPTGTAADSTRPAALPDSGPVPPCPYCGALNAREQRTCRTCSRSLMIRAPRRAARSVPLTIVGVLTLISAVLTLLGGLGLMILAILAYAALASLARQFDPQAAVPFPMELVVPGVLVLMYGGFSFAQGRGLLRRARWAFWVTAVLTALGLLVGICQFLAGAAMMGSVVSAIPTADLPPEAQGMFEGALAGTGIGMVVGLAMQVVYACLVAASYRDFYGPRVRFMAELEPADDATHYNSGLSFKSRGMWYMAVKEWEAAAKLAPRDKDYSHALALGYAQLGQYDQALVTLNKALAFHPGDAQLLDSRSAIEQRITHA